MAEKILSVYRDRYTSTAAVMEFGFGLEVDLAQKDIIKTVDRNYPNNFCFVGEMKKAGIIFDGSNIEADVDIVGYTRSNPDGSVLTGVELCRCRQFDNSGVEFCGKELALRINDRIDQVKCRLEGGCQAPLK